MRRIGAAVLVVFLAMTVLAGCASGGGDAGGNDTGTGTGGTSAPPTGGTSGGNSVDVVMKGFAFSPAEVEIAVGDSVTWTNEDSATHDATGDGGIASGSLGQGETYTKTFDTAGTYEYICGIHPSMTGTVVVK